MFKYKVECFRIYLLSLAIIISGASLFCSYFLKTTNPSQILEIFFEYQIIIWLLIFLTLFISLRYIRYYREKKIDNSFNELSDSLALAIIKIGRDGYIKSFNKKAESMFGYKKSLVLNKNIKTLLKKDDILLFNSKGLKPALRHGDARVSLYIRKKNSDLIPTEILLNKIEEAGIVYFNLIFIDISEYKNIEENLGLHISDLQHMIDRQIYELRLFKSKAEIADKIKDEFISNVSHELKTPMHAILSFSKMGIERIDSIKKEKMLEYLGDIRRSGERLLRLVNDLLDISKLESGTKELKISENDFFEVLKEVLKEISSLFEEKKLKIELAKDNASSLCLFDKERIIQVLINILSNAIKFTPEQGIIKIDISEFCLISNSLSEHELENTIGVNKHSIENDLSFIAHSPPIKGLLRLKKKSGLINFSKHNRKHFISLGVEIFEEFIHQGHYQNILFYHIKETEADIIINGLHNKIDDKISNDDNFDKWHKKLSNKIRNLNSNTIMHYVYIPQEPEKDGVLCSLHPIYSDKKIYGFIEIRTLLNKKMMAKVVRNGNAIMVSVFNEGPTIPDDELEYIFDKFIQSRITKTGAGGTGLGLSISKEIISLHRGKIWAESEKGKGTTLKFAIPTSFENKTILPS